MKQDYKNGFCKSNANNKCHEFMEHIHLFIPPSSFFYTISHIIRACSNPKMGRIYARRIITSMKNPQASWNRSIMQFIRKTMSTLIPIKSSISIQASTSTFPNPTIWSFFNKFPEAYFGRNDWLSANIFFGKILLHWKLTPFSAMPQVAQTTLGLSYA
jgi:hypothetical protein